MLLATDVVTNSDRQWARQSIHNHDQVRWLAVHVLRAVNYGAIDIVDAAIGEGHGRGILVATHEGVDRLLGATLDLMESCAAERVFSRVDPLDPLGLGEPIDEPGRERMRVRLVRTPLEGAILRLAAAGNDLVNAHLLLAWEANCTTAAELRRFRIDPEDPSRNHWATIEKVREALPPLSRRPMALLPAMWLTSELQRLLLDDAVRETRQWRDVVAHRERLGFAEAPAFGRRSLWDSPGTQVTFPRLDATDPSLPTVACRRKRLVEAADALLRYAEALWRVQCDFFASLGVRISSTLAEGTIEAQVQPGAFPRAQRDPTLLLRPPTASA